MTIQKNDPRLTAYLLGELAPEEAKEVEEALDQDPQLRTELFLTEQTIKELRAALHNEPLPQLTTQEKIRLEEKMKKKERTRLFPLRLGFGLATGLAALLLIVISRYPGYLSFSPKPEPVLGVLDHIRNESQNETTRETLGQQEQPLPMNKKSPLSKEKDGRMPAPSGELGVLDADRAPLFNTETYDRINDNSLIAVRQDPLSTFSIDVDTASYSNMRRFITQGSLPPPDAVRIEEMINYFPYDYPQPESGPFSVNVETAASPWHPDYRLVRIGIKGKDVNWNERPSSNLVFLLDVSGSMDEPNKLPLLKQGMKLLIDKLSGKDRVAMVVYAGASGLVLPSTPADKKEVLTQALEKLQAGGSTNGGEGIELAYKIAKENFVKGGINRVILATDGDFNVGVTNQGDLTRLIEEKAKTGVFLSVLGFGMGNYKDSTLEKLADQGNGNYAYIDNIQEAKKVLAQQVGGTLLTIAKDVKIQVEFNPATVSAYRLIGYENRLLRHEDFNNDKKDAGDIGAGHTVTALYEIVPAGKSVDVPSVDPLKYQKPSQPLAGSTNELLTLKLRYKDPEASTSRLLSYPVLDSGNAFTQASTDFKFVAAVASFGMILRDSKEVGGVTLNGVLDMAQAGKGKDENGYRAEFIQLVNQAKGLKKGN